MKNKRTKISQSFQRWLLVLVIVAFLTTTVFLWIIQTKLAENNAISLLELNIADVREDIIDASNANLLEMSQQIAQDLDAVPSINNDYLQVLTARYDVPEINCIGPNGVIYASTTRIFWTTKWQAANSPRSFWCCLPVRKPMFRAISLSPMTPLFYVNTVAL